MRAAVLHVFRAGSAVAGVPAAGPARRREADRGDGGAGCNDVNRVRADGSHYSVRTGEFASGGLSRSAPG